MSESFEEIQKRIREAEAKGRIIEINFPQEPAERVAYAMAMACKYLATVNVMVSEKDPVFIVGDKKDELQYLWTAFMILGERQPKNTRFNHKSIRIRNEYA